MHKIGLKLWNINTDYYFEEAKKLYQDNIFDYIELYVVPRNINNINKWETLNIPFDIHAPHYKHNMNLSDVNKYFKNYEMYNEVKEYADILNSNTIVFHGGIDGDYRETARQIKTFNDKRIVIENKPYKPLQPSNLDHCIGSKFDEISFIMKACNCGFCLDIGHAVCSANSQGIDPYNYIEEFLLLKPKRIHLSDIHINSIYDEHLNFGNGNLDFNKIIYMLPDDISITIETNKNSKFNLNDFKNDSMYLKKILKF